MKNKLSVLLGERKESVMYLSGKLVFLQLLCIVYITKKQNPDTKTIMVLCKYFDVTPNEFLALIVWRISNMQKLNIGIYTSAIKKRAIPKSN